MGLNYTGTNKIGGYFALANQNPPAASGALIIDNAAVAANIFEARDNGTAVFTIADGGQMRALAGSATTPGISFIAETGTGLYQATNRMNAAIAQGDHWSFNAGGSVAELQLGNTTTFSWSSTDPPTAADGDTFISRDAAATIQLGNDVNGAAVNQTLKAHDGITGTDIKGASLTLAPGLGTGAAVSNPLTLNRVVTKATGTTAQTYSPAVVVCPTKILSNTSATAQTIATITTTSTTGGNVTMDYTTVANNGTLQDTDSGMVKVSWNNNAGTVAATMSAVALQSDQDASGTLATTPTATVATNVVSIKFTPTWVTIVPTTVTGWALFHLATSGDTVVCQ